jgi:hypothetical protein
MLIHTAQNVECRGKLPQDSPISPFISFKNSRDRPKSQASAVISHAPQVPMCKQPDNTSGLAVCDHP